MLMTMTDMAEGDDIALFKADAKINESTEKDMKWIWRAGDVSEGMMKMILDTNVENLKMYGTGIRL